MAGEQTGGGVDNTGLPVTQSDGGADRNAALNQAADRLRQIDRRSTPRGTREQQREAKQGADIDLRRYSAELDDDGTTENPGEGTEPEQSSEVAEQDATKAPADLDPTEVVFYDKEGKPWTRQEAADGVLRQADYSRKTAEVADRGKRLSETQALVDQAANLAARAMQNIAMAINGQLPPIPPEPPAEMEQSDPIGFFMQARKRDQILAQHQQVAQQAMQIQQQQAVIRERQEQAERVEQEQLLITRVPSWKDEAVRKREMGEIMQYCKDIGHKSVTAKEFEGANHMLLYALRDAALGAKIRKNGGKKLPTAPGLPPGRPVGTLTGRERQATRGELAERMSDKRVPVQERTNAAATALRQISQRRGSR